MQIEFEYHIKTRNQLQKHLAVSINILVIMFFFLILSAILKFEIFKKKSFLKKNQN